MRTRLLAAALAAAASADAAQPPAAPARAAPAAATTLLAGFAKRTITPELGSRPVYLAGFANDRRSTGVHDPLWARAVAVADREGRCKVVLVAVDLIGLFNDDVRKARALLEARAPGAQLLVASTHDHEGPDTMGLWGKGRFSSGVDKDYLGRVRVAIVDAAQEALSRLQPARLVMAGTRTPGLIEDARLPRVLDDTLVALQFVAGDGTTLGTLVDWSSHPEALGGSNTLVSSDYPHYLRERVEQRLGGSCVFVVGSIGGLLTPLGVKGSFAFAQGVGERAAEAAVDALRHGHSSVSTALEYRGETVYLPLENRLFRLAMFLGVLDRGLYSHGRPATTLFGDELRSEIGYLRLGDAEALLVPGEVYPELVVGGIQAPQDPGADFPGAPPERPLASLLRAEHRFVIGLANDEIGYLIPRSQWDEKKPYAYGRTEAQYGEVNSVGPSAAARLADAFARLVGR